MTISKRLNWDEYALKLAFDAAERSEDPYIRVGACGLSKKNRTLGTGYNGLAPNVNVSAEFWEDRDYRRTYMIHAEVNFFSHKSHKKCHLLACTLLPCSACATLIVANGVKRVVYGETYNRDTKALDIFKFYNIEVQHMQEFYNSLKT